MAIDLTSFGLDHLSRDDKLELVGQLWNSIVEPEPPGSLLTDAQRDELRRRAAAALDPDDFVEWSDVVAATLKRLSQ